MRLEVRCEDRVGMAREILDLLVPYQIDMRRIEVDTRQGCLYVGFDDIAFSHLTQLLSDIRRLKGVSDVKTVQYTPSEREQNAVHTLLEALPDGVIAVDVKGIVTNITSRAANDIGVPLEQLVRQPLSRFIKSIAFERLDWANLQHGLTKRIRLNGQLVLLEMQSFFVSNENAQQVCAGGVIYIRSAKRLGRQTSSLRKAPVAVEGLQGFLKTELTQSAAMQRCLQFALAYVANEGPMLLTGEYAVGKKRLLEALFHYWQSQCLEYDCALTFAQASNLTPASLEEMLSVAGWLAILDIEKLSTECQLTLLQWLQDQPSQLYQEEAPSRVIGVSCHSTEDLRLQTGFLSELYHSLAAYQLCVPPLRERKEDMIGLLNEVLRETHEGYGLTQFEVSKDALVTLKMHDWPGNLKEFRSCIHQAYQVAENGIIELNDIPIHTSQSMPIELMDGSLDKTVKAYEAELLRKLYPQYPSTRKLAAFLKVSHSSIANKLKEYGIV